MMFCVLGTTIFTYFMNARSPDPAMDTKSNSKTFFLVFEPFHTRLASSLKNVQIFSPKIQIWKKILLANFPLKRYKKVTRQKLEGKENVLTVMKDEK